MWMMTAPQAAALNGGWGVCLPGGFGVHFVVLPALPAGAGRGKCLRFPDLQRLLEHTTVVKIRLKRFGRRNRPFYRINAIDQRTARDGKVIEQLGWYDPINKDESKQFFVKKERAAYWLSVGAQPSETVASILRKSGVEPKPGKKISD